MNEVSAFSNELIEAEALRLLRSLMHVECSSGRKWNIETCREIAPLTLEINQLKKDKNAVVLTHSYVEPEIVYGVGDFKGILLMNLEIFVLGKLCQQYRYQIIINLNDL